MRMREPGAPSGHDPSQVFWYSSVGAEPPASIASVLDLVTETAWPLARPAMCICHVPAADLGPAVEAMRDAVGPEVYMIGLVDRIVPPAAVSEVIESGFDDAFLLGDADGRRGALARGRRVVANRLQSIAFHQRYALERDYLQACIDNLPTPIFFKNGRGIYVGCNKAFEDYLGLSSEEIIGNSVWDVSPATCAQKYQEADEELMAQGGVQVYEGRVRYNDGTLRDVSFHKAVIVDGDGAVRGIAGAMLDITERKQLETDLKRAAECDPLTNLYNRRKFFECAREIATHAVEESLPVTIAVIDIDHFKAVNDGYGHAVGDEVLCRVAEVMRLEMGEETVVARAGGEEFYAMLPGYETTLASVHLERLRRKVADLAIDAEGTPMGVTISIGLAAFDPNRETLSESLKRADWALYRAKNGGRNQLVRAA
ncbi:diguanylate cyclase [Pseudomonas sp. R2.Fl]|nr:diguanylate cyclase [Pseudomonas sp. R2.Fl]